jgi:hypothetical protein
MEHLASGALREAVTVEHKSYGVRAIQEYARIFADAPSTEEVLEQCPGLECFISRAALEFLNEFIPSSIADPDNPGLLPEALRSYMLLGIRMGIVLEQNESASRAIKALLRDVGQSPDDQS